LCYNNKTNKTKKEGEKRKKKKEREKKKKKMENQKNQQVEMVGDQTNSKPDSQTLEERKKKITCSGTVKLQS
jgi:hypothetical protein